MKSIFQYSASREFLRAAIESAKGSAPGLSIELYADRIGLGRSTLKMILSGKRNLTASHVHKIAKALRLSVSETEYLQSLSLRERSRDPAERLFYAKSAKAMKKRNLASSYPISAKGVLADPYILPILVYLTDFHQNKDQDSFKIDAGEINAMADRFKIEPLRISKAIEVLVSLGFIQMRGNGGGVHYVFSRFTQVIHQQQYLKSWCTEAIKRIDSEYDSTTSFFNASTLTISPELLPQMMRDLRTVIDKYIAMPVLVPSPDGSMIIQSCIQLFPVMT